MNRETERELLFYVKQVREGKADGSLKGESWSVIREFSPIRENLLRFVDIRGDEKVLEIGSGSGALTGVLSERAASVDCVEESETLNIVNRLRHENARNITIHCGRFQTAEDDLPRDFDLVTLIGILPHAAEYMDGEDPYRELLSAAVRHAKKGGRLVLALPNRLGMRYFAGCADEVTGNYFAGIEGGTDGKGGKTFSKPALASLLARSGIQKAEFYYPYPDYLFTAAVYSDRYLPRVGDLRMNRMNFDYKRLALFDEGRAFDSIADEGLFPLFSNSFLVIAEAEP